MFGKYWGPWSMLAPKIGYRLTSLKSVSCICASLASTLWAQNMIGQSIHPFCPWSALVHVSWALLSGPSLLAPFTGFGLGLEFMDVRVQTLS